MFKVILAIIKTYKKYIITAGIVIALIFGGKAYLNRLEDNAYNKGYQTSEQVWKEERSTMQHTIDNKFIENTHLVAALRARTAEQKKLIDEADKATNKKQVEYAASDNGKKASLDNKFIEVYNESLEVK